MDIHKPKPWHGFREFLKEYLIIVIGVLTALGAEQAVEYGHRVGQVRQARHALEREHKYNIEEFALLTDDLYLDVPEVQQDVALFAFLRKHAGHTIDRWPYDFIPLNVQSFRLSDSAWKNAERSNVVQFMPVEEVEKYRREYFLIGYINDRESDTLSKLYDARRPFIEASTVRQFTLPQIDNELDALSDLLLLYLNLAQRQRNLSRAVPEYAHAPDARVSVQSVVSSTWMDQHISKDYQKAHSDLIKSLMLRKQKLDERFGLN
jgi:hypothetical protein